MEVFIRQSALLELIEEMTEHWETDEVRGWEGDIWEVVKSFVVVVKEEKEEEMLTGDGERTKVEWSEVRWGSK